MIAWLMVATVVIGALFLRPYMMLIIVSAVVAFLFNPLYQWLLKKGRSTGQAALLTFIASMLVVIIPLVVVILLTTLQIQSLLHNLTSSNSDLNTSDLITRFVNWVNNFIAGIGGSYHLTVQQATDWVIQTFESFGKSFLNGLVSSLSGLFGLITTAVIYIYVFMSMVRSQDKIITVIRQLNPLGDEIGNLYLQRIGAMTKSTVRGQFIIAFLQGTESAIVLALVGFGNLFFFFEILLTVLSVIPLGAGIVTIPIGIGLILTGNVWQGVVVIANHLLIVTNIDNVMRPRLVSSHARLDPALMILAVFSGIYLFGFLGIIVGPVLMIVLITTLQVFLEVHRQTEAITPANSDPRAGVLKKLGKRWHRKSQKI